MMTDRQGRFVKRDGLSHEKICLLPQLAVQCCCSLL
jgi:hypothetical protein